MMTTVFMPFILRQQRIQNTVKHLSKTVLFVKITNGFHAFTIFAKKLNFRCLNEFYMRV